MDKPTRRSVTTTEHRSVRGGTIRTIHSKPDTHYDSRCRIRLKYANPIRRIVTGTEQGDMSVTDWMTILLYIEQLSNCSPWSSNWVARCLSVELVGKVLPQTCISLVSFNPSKGYLVDITVSDKIAIAPID